MAETKASIYAEDSDELDRLRYLPPECDVPIRANWFWQPDDVDTLKTREHLLAIWYQSVGLGANLLLNLAPDRSGLIPITDVDRLLETTGELRRRFAEPTTGRIHGGAGEVTVTFSSPVAFDHLELREDLGAGQQIETHDIIVADSVVSSGRSVGVRRWHAFSPVTADQLTVRFTGGSAARLSAVTAFRTGHSAIPRLPVC